MTVRAQSRDLMDGEDASQVRGCCQRDFNGGGASAGGWAAHKCQCNWPELSIAFHERTVLMRVGLCSLPLVFPSATCIVKAIVTRFVSSVEMKSRGFESTMGNRTDFDTGSRALVADSHLKVTSSTVDIGQLLTGPNNDGK